MGKSEKEMGLPSATSLRAPSATSVRAPSVASVTSQTSAYGRELDWIWDSYGNWSTYASNQDFWKTRLSEPDHQKLSHLPLPVTDHSYSSVDWIIKDIMDSYPSLDRVKAEQQLRKEKLELTSALLDLRVTKIKEDDLGKYETELEKIVVLKNRFVESVYQFLSNFSHEVCDDDRILYRDEISDIEMKVSEHAAEIRKQATNMKTLQQYKSILDKGKGHKLDTILEMCKEIDEIGMDSTENPANKNKD